MDLCTTWQEHLIGALPSDRGSPTFARRSPGVRHRPHTDKLPGNPVRRSLLLKYLPELEADVNLLNIVRPSLRIINPIMHWRSEGGLSELDRGIRDVPHGRE